MGCREFDHFYDNGRCINCDERQVYSHVVFNLKQDRRYRLLKKLCRDYALKQNPHGERHLQILVAVRILELLNTRRERTNERRR